MSTYAYIDRKFRHESLVMINQVNAIIADFQAQGFVLTVRQLYYQLVTRNIIANNERSYQNTCSIVNDGRLAGLIDWDMIEDRTREFIERARWVDGGEILDSVARQFHTDMWENQDRRVFVIVEKEALIGVLEPLCRELDVPLLAARGYPSASVLRDFAVRNLGQRDLILHLGDHDPSGMDMTRDLTDRLQLFLGVDDGDLELRRIALNMPQIQALKPPPNPAKLSDSRADGYVRRFGRQSWELDALKPQYLVDLVRQNIEAEIDQAYWEKRQEFITATKAKLATMAKRWKL